MNLLIVDDDLTNLKLLRTQLESEGHAVFEAHDGVEALALLERQRVDAVISDILMPRMDGYRLCHEIRQHVRLHDLPIIIYSSTYTAPEDEKLSLNMGANKYLEKPASVETIIAALYEVIAQPQAAPRPDAQREVEVLKEYNERLISKLKEKNTELQAAEVKFRSLVEQSIVGIYIIQDDQFVYVNPRMAGIFGRSEEEMTSRTLYDFVVPEEHALVRENIRKRISGKVPSIHYHLRMLHQSGAVLQVEVHSSRMEYNGRPAVMGTLLDITERKRAEERIQKGLKLETALRRIDEKILEGANFLEALDTACDATVEMGYRMCWVGQAMPDHTVCPVASKGFNPGFLENIDFRWDDSPEGQGPTGISIRTGQPCVIQNIGESSFYAPWRGIALEHGCLSSASFPLKSPGGGSRGSSACLRRPYRCIRRRGNWPADDVCPAVHDRPPELPAAGGTARHDPAPGLPYRADAPGVH